MTALNLCALSLSEQEATAMQAMTGRNTGAELNCKCRTNTTVDMLLTRGLQKVATAHRMQAIMA